MIDKEEDKPLCPPTDKRSAEWREKFNMAHWKATWIARNYWQGIDVAVGGGFVSEGRRTSWRSS